MPPMEPPRAQRALLSVFDKRGLVELGRGLSALGIELVASGGSAAALKQAGLPVLEVEELTGSPEMLGGRVKTLHPKIHGGILARRELESDRAQLAEHGIQTLDLVVANLYPFEDTVAEPGVTRAEAIEKIDIGGPSMIRSAAKNHAHVGVVVDPDDYPQVLDELRETGGLAESTRRRLALKAFQRTAAYDAAIQAWLADQEPPFESDSEFGSESDGESDSEGDGLPEQLIVALGKSQGLRYGENPHQRAALYGGFLEAVEQHHGKDLSYNNLVDVQAALALVLEFDPQEDAAVAILKHNTPCGAGSGDTPLKAYRRAFETDPDSPFGGIIVSNRPFDLALAKEVDQIFTEVLVAPGFAPDALELLRKKKNRRLLSFESTRIQRAELEWRRVYGGVLLQEPDCRSQDLATAEVVTQRKPDDAELRAMGFAWKVVKHVKSNAIVFGSDARTLAVGGGATSRVDAVYAAIAKAARVGLSLEGSVLASDAFFPFPDALEIAVEAGARAVVQPGGSNRDPEVIEAADRLGITMIRTGTRHFRH